MTKKRSKIRSGDFERILVSETSPFDVPIVFSNNWFYYNMRFKTKHHQDVRDVIKKLFEEATLQRYTIPLNYRIRKGNDGYRYMGVLHPSSQLNVLEFYKEYAPHLIHYCTKSDFSLRRPQKVASTFYLSNKLDSVKKYRIDGAEKVSDERKFKHATSFFAYSECTKLHQFFESKTFLELEGKYTEFWSLDISKCFQSIYTHSIEWAAKNKYEGKINSSNKSFGTTFDKLMQTSNYNETNGIVIGNEASRLFAEVILQKIDLDVEKQLESLDIFHGRHYEIKRYVDDYFVFTSSEAVGKTILDIICEKLRPYRLYLNESKTIKSRRPFITSITKAKMQVSIAIDELVAILFRVNPKGQLRVNSDKIRKTHLVVKSFMNKVQSACFNDLQAYDVMTGYVISALLNKCKEIAEITKEEVIEELYPFYRDVFEIILDISFRLFSICSSYANSLKLSMMCYISFVFFDNSYPLENKTIKLKINSLIKKFFESGEFSKNIDSRNKYFSIEFANLLCVSRNMGKDYLLNEEQIESVFNIDSVINSKSQNHNEAEESSDYFSIVCLLYYIGNEPEYFKLKNKLTKTISKKLNSLNEIVIDANLCFLTLDSISCPFIREDDRFKWSKRLFKVIYGKEGSKDEQNRFFINVSSTKWFISWDYADLWNVLEKKELLFEY